MGKACLGNGVWGGLHLNFCLGVLIAGIQVGGEEVVADAHLRCCVDKAVTVDTRQAPVVLTFQERAAGEAVHLQGHHVLALDQVFRNVELRRQVGVLRVAHALAVHPEVVTVAHAVEAHEDIVAGEPVGVHRECLAVSAHGIGHRTVIGEPPRTLGHDAERRAVILERVLRVAVERLVPRLVVVQAPHLPARGHVDVGPGSVVVVRCTHGGGGLRRRVHPLELPLPVEREVVGRQRHVVLHGVSLRGHGQAVGMCRLAVNTRCERVVPLLARLGIHASYGEEGVQTNYKSAVV